MNNSVKTIAIVAAAMVTIGILLTGIGWMAGGNQSIYIDRDGIHVGGHADADYGSLESFSQDVGSFSSINVDLDYYDVDLIPGDKYAVDGTFFSNEGKPDVKVENGTLTVMEKNHNRINLSIDLQGLFTSDNQPRIKIYYPKDVQFQDLVIKCDSSDLSYENLTVTDRAEFDLDLGKLEINGISAKNVKVSMDSGDCTVKNIKADVLDLSNNLGKITLDGAELKTFKIDADSGGISLTGVTADSGELYADLGRISGRDLATNGLKVESDSGEVDLQGKLFGVTDISSDMGAVTVNPGAPRDQFNYELNADMGSVTLGGDNFNGNVVMNNGTAKNSLKINTDMGAIKVNFD